MTRLATSIAGGTTAMLLLMLNSSAIVLRKSFDMPAIQKLPSTRQHHGPGIGDNEFDNHFSFGFGLLSALIQEEL